MAVDGNAAARARAIEARLAGLYGPAEKPRLDPLDELILTILSQNTNDTNRDRAWCELRRRFSDWSAVLAASRAELEAAIRVAGLANRKAMAIHGVLDRLREEVGEPSLAHLERMGDAEALDYLSSFKGVGVKTAACVLCFSLRRPVMPVDTHVHRVGCRLGLVPAKGDALAAHRVLNETVPSELRFSLHVQLIRHGRAVCTARRPACGGCVLADDCPGRSAQ